MRMLSSCTYHASTPANALSQEFFQSRSACFMSNTCIAGALQNVTAPKDQNSLSTMLVPAERNAMRMAAQMHCKALSELPAPIGMDSTVSLLPCTLG